MLIFSGGKVFPALRSAACFFIFVSVFFFSQLSQAGDIHCPDMIKIPHSEQDIDTAVKKAFGLGDAAQILIDKSQLTFQQPFEQPGNYKLKHGKFTRVDSQGAVSRMECTYRGGGKNNVAIFEFSPDFYFQQKIMAGNLEPGEWTCISSDFKSGQGNEICELRAGFILALNKLHCDQNQQVNLMMRSVNSETAVIHAGKYKAVRMDGHYIQLSLFDHEGEHDITTSCRGENHGVLPINAESLMAIEVSGVATYSGVSQLRCEINRQKSDKKLNTNGWSYASWFGGTKSQRPHGEKSEKPKKPNNNNDSDQKKFSGNGQGVIDWIADWIAYYFVLPEYSSSTRKAYEELGLELGAEWEDIREQYKKLAMVHHPDKNNQGDNQKFIDLKDAYEVLKGFKHKK